MFGTKDSLIEDSYSKLEYMLTTSFSRTAKSESPFQTRLVPLPKITLLNEAVLITANYDWLHNPK